MKPQMANRSFAATIQRLAARWQEAKVLLPLFPLLAKGEPLEIDRVAQATGVSAALIERAAAAGSCARDVDGRLLDLYGMTLSPTLHRVEVDSRIVYSCCALWAHVIPKLVGRKVKVESVDPLRRELVRLSIRPNGIEIVEPVGATATMAVASEEALREDVGKAFCKQVHHFVSRDSADEFARNSALCSVVDLEQLQEHAEHLYQALWNVAHAS